MQGFFNTISEIRKLPENEFIKLMENLKNDVNHNYKNITTGKFRRVSNDDFFKEVVNACS